MKLLNTLESGLVKILENLLKVCLVVMTLGVFSQVILRMIFKRTFLPIEDILPYSFSITTFAGSALLFREKGHIAITFLTDSIRGKAGIILQFLSDVFIFVFLGIFLIWGTIFMLSGNYQFSPLLKIPLLYIFIVVPLFAFSSIVFLIRRYERITRGK
ncbi:MAG: TRAP transporter small permease subunit [Spirochaetales bacterium]